MLAVLVTRIVVFTMSTMKEEGMQDIWQRLLAELANSLPDLVARLRPGVEEAAMLQAEQQLGVVLPEDVKAYFRVQNGSDGPLFGSWQLLSLEEMCHDWLTLKEQPRRPPSWDEPPWDEAWLPLARSGPSLALPAMRLYVDLLAPEVEPEVENEEDSLFEPVTKSGRLF